MEQQKRHIVIAGGSKRLGLYIASKLTGQDHRLSILYRTDSTELVHLKSQFPSLVDLHRFDLSHIHEISSLGQILSQKHGPITDCITVASQFYPTPLGTVTEQQWDELFDTNVKGHFFLLQGLIPFLAQSSQITSLVDIYAFKPLKSYSAYCSAKGALLQLIRNLALELSPRTRVNAISPGAVLPPPDFTSEENVRIAQRIPLARWGSPEDIYQAFMFLMRNQYITGMNLCVDGGASLL